ncbi:uncharacterized protein LOC123314390 [Coccinella septempunctata]|uniref:uncharacterized protein LOC123314390 n=1 Tax=Coccinella septempunctata TaxID=41139 RepID=UPI001D07E328|nr:uncharacterized protein LOC123314390 [Coccinella septempunctata]
MLRTFCDSTFFFLRFPRVPEIKEVGDWNVRLVPCHPEKYHIYYIHTKKPNPSLGNDGYHGQRHKQRKRTTNFGTWNTQRISGLMNKNKNKFITSPQTNNHCMGQVIQFYNNNIDLYKIRIAIELM